ncbi:MAG: lytic transglycosylase domain-containing protein [Spirochaetaceae bacterium]|nr:lytic transglycosylase domain-containing protein [Spirochaetaceae bacterium]
MVFVVSLGACDPNFILDLPVAEAAGRLEAGDIDFILNADPRRIDELRRLHPSALFYAGLLVQSREAGGVMGDKPGGIGLSALLFESALESPSPKVQDAAAAELLKAVLEGEDGVLAERLLPGLRKKRAVFAGAPFLEELYGAALYALGRFDELSALYQDREPPSLRGRSLFLLASLRRGENTRRELLDFFLSEPLRDPHHWAFREIEKFPPAFSNSEAAAVAGRFSVSRFFYDAGLQHFRIPLAEGPRLFFEYPELLSDLGKAFQYTAAGKEGIKLFLEWDDLITAGKAGLAGGDTGDIRFRLWYYGGRIQRQGEQYGEAARSFARALPFAPTPLQRDACIWYILRINLDENPAGMIPLLGAYVPRWHSDVYFADILDLLSRELLVKRQWDSFLEVFSLIRGGTDGATRAKYAYIIGRAVMEGYIPAVKAGAARDYFRIAMEEKGAPWYYRALSASYLGEKLPPIPKKVPAPVPGDRVDFFRDFFTYGAGTYAFLYLRPVMEELTIPELRLLAETFAKAGRWGESIRISAHYMSRDDYEPDLWDLELAYPRPFSRLIEESARKEGLSPEILYGLIRTESAFIPDIGSRAGAIGLTQLMPATAMEMAGRIRREGGLEYPDREELDLRDPDINVPLGARYLRYLIDRMGSLMPALLAYNGGMGRIPRWRAAQKDLPEDLFPETIELSETRDYGRKVLSAAAVYGYLYYGMTMEAVIADIFKAGQ